MSIEYFLKFYTAFAEDKSQAQSTEKAVVEVSQRNPPVGSHSTVLGVDKFGRSADAHSY
jgi:hypothetical protein